MGDALEKILECPICLEQIQNPKMLPCQHSFCMDKCLGKLLKTFDYQRKVTCPMCMEEFPIPKDGFPTHYVLQNLLEKQEIKMPAVSSLFSKMNLKSDSNSDINTTANAAVVPLENRVNIPFIFTLLESIIQEQPNQSLALSGFKWQKELFTVVELLQSERPSDDLQSELFDLLGFDQTQNVLKFRSDLIGLKNQ